ncbi:ParB/RepB/Spo0J family partition protein [Nocardia tengchongensis]|uniref:ParB/RepB/Spo0J family partition protein n=1 Tax=Nocardia tengchongensis TaxID=2055889 RepID=UPI003618C328
MSGARAGLKKISGADRLRGGGAPNPLLEALSGNTITVTEPDGESAGVDVAAVLADIHKRAEEVGLSVIKVAVDQLAPHPRNSPRRSRPRPGYQKWEELVESIRGTGVLVPLLVCTREAYIAAYPDLAGQVPETAAYVVVYGHRRRAGALEAGVDQIPVIIDDSILTDGGDLDALVRENTGRDDLDRIELAHHLAIYGDEGMSTRAIAARAGLKQPTVQRHLALNLLIPQAQDAVSDDKLGLMEAVDLAAALPFGPPRKWQREHDEQQDSAERASEQLAVLDLIAQDVTPQRAVQRVVAERNSRATAQRIGLTLVDDPVARFGEAMEAHRLLEAPVEADDNIVAAIDDKTGSLSFFAVEVPETVEESAGEGSGATDGDAASATTDTDAPAPRTPKDDDSRDRVAAQRGRRTAAAALAAKGTSRDKLAALLINLTRHRVRTDQPRAWTLAHTWLRQAEVCDTLTPELWQDQVARESDPKTTQRSLWAVALASCELRASDKDRPWDVLDAAYLDILSEAGGFAPTGWEAHQIRRIGTVA